MLQNSALIFTNTWNRTRRKRLNIKCLHCFLWSHDWSHYRYCDLLVWSRLSRVSSYLYQWKHLAVIRPTLFNKPTYRVCTRLLDCHLITTKQTSTTYCTLQRGNITAFWMNSTAGFFEFWQERKVFKCRNMNSSYSVHTAKNWAIALKENPVLHCVYKLWNILCLHSRKHSWPLWP